MSKRPTLALKCEVCRHAEVLRGDDPEKFQDLIKSSGWTVKQELIACPECSKLSKGED